ncbi:helix-turn-helix domain-containing protein [Streptomyces sp. NPDC090741]|uniref:helix-turn-helix domain-containing protein n=1 Tax=Streptomyces sp. NPDC090741 TaxID=3365967 RepID=UPI0037F9CBA4
MGRPEHPVDFTVQECGVLARRLRVLRRDAGLTYDELATETGLSAATLKRAASGKTLPALKTAEKFAAACGGAKGRVQRLWLEARIADRGRLEELRRPAAPHLVSSPAELSVALEFFYERAGTPSLRELQQRAGGDARLVLPISSAARIVSRQTLPASGRQLRAFLAGCGLSSRSKDRWVKAYTRVLHNEDAVFTRAAVEDRPTRLIDSDPHVWVWVADRWQRTA